MLIEKVKSGSPLVLMAFGETTEGTILQVCIVLCCGKGNC